MAVIYGIHAVEEALLAGNRHVDYVEVARERHDQRLQSVIDLARRQGVPLRFVPREQLDRAARAKSHQGVLATLAEQQYSDLEDLLQGSARPKFLLVLDGIEDPHNLGALIRSADGAGADGVIIPERRAAAVNATVAKASAGASEHVKIARVVNLARTLEQLKERNIWMVGLDERGSAGYDQIDYKMDCALVLGAEGKGLHDLVRKKCDYVVSIPMMGRVPSLNVSVAGGIVMYEVARQRRALRAETVRPEAPKKAKGLGS